MKIRSSNRLDTGPPDVNKSAGQAATPVQAQHHRSNSTRAYHTRQYAPRGLVSIEAALPSDAWHWLLGMISQGGRP